MTMFALVLGLLITYFIYNDGKKRGQNQVVALLWGIGSAVFPVVGLPLYFIFGRKGQVPDKGQDDGIIDIEASVVEEQTICLGCGKEMGQALMVCPYCNHTVKHG